MAKFYAKQQVGVSDGTKNPALAADGREVGAKTRVMLASKVTGTAWASGDTVVLGKIPQGEKVVNVQVCTGTSFGSATLSIGTAAAPTKYVNAKTNTVVDAVVSIGPAAATLSAAVGAASEELILTVGAATIAAGTEATFIITTSGL